MTTRVAFLRGINVGGHNRLLMADLRTLVESLGYRGVDTHIQSGNVVFDAPGEDTQAIGEDLEAAVAREFGYDVPIMVRTRVELDRIVSGTPFTGPGEHVKRYVTLLATEPAGERVDALEAAAAAGERYVVTGREVYTEIDPALLGHAGTADVERLLRVPATRRNWSVVTAVRELARE